MVTYKRRAAGAGQSEAKGRHVGDGCHVSAPIPATVQYEGRAAHSTLVNLHWRPEKRYVWIHLDVVILFAGLAELMVAVEKLYFVPLKAVYQLRPNVAKAEDSKDEEMSTDVDTGEKAKDTDKDKKPNTSQVFQVQTQSSKRQITVSTVISRSKMESWIPLRLYDETTRNAHEVYDRMTMIEDEGKLLKAITSKATGTQLQYEYLRKVIFGRDQKIGSISVDRIDM